MTARTLAAILVVSGVGLALLSLASGPVRIPLTEVVRVLGSVAGLGSPAEPIHAGVVLTLRLPRMLLAAEVGAALGVSGAVLQGLFRNPLVEPGLVGVSSGATLAAAATLLLSATPALAPLAAFLGGLGVAATVTALARGPSGTVVQWLLLAGIAVNALCGALVGLLLFAADDAGLRSFTFWTLGSVGGATGGSVAMVAILGVVPALAATRLAPVLDVLAFGEAEAAHIGVRVERVKRVAVVLAALAVGASVAACGTVGFVGLVAPHLVRLAVGPSHRVLLPASLGAGAVLVLGADLVARTVAAPAEVPLGVVTASVGAPFLLFLLARARRAEAAC